MVARIDLSTGATMQLSCSWRSHAGADARIEATFCGSRGAARLRNVDGSFYDFVAEHLVGARRAVVAGPPDAWGGRALLSWIDQLAADGRYASSGETARSMLEVHRALDQLCAIDDGAARAQDLALSPVG